MGILGIVCRAQAMVAIAAAAGALLGDFYLIIIPAFVFPLLLIGSSVPTLWEG